MLPAFRKTHLGDASLQHFQDNVDQGFAKLIGENGCVLLDGVRLTSQVLGAGVDTTLNHKLGRVPLGRIITKQLAAAATVFDVSFSATTIVLHASALCTVDLWLF